jgi:hypothetical protein
MVLLIGTHVFGNDWGKSLTLAGFTPENQKQISRVSGVAGRLCQTAISQNGGCLAKEMFDLLSPYEKEKLRMCLDDRLAKNGTLVVDSSDKLALQECTKIPLYIREIDQDHRFLYAGKFVCSLSNGVDSLYVQTCHVITDETD